MGGLVRGGSPDVTAPAFSMQLKKPPPQLQQIPCSAYSAQAQLQGITRSAAGHNTRPQRARQAQVPSRPGKPCPPDLTRLMLSSLTKSTTAPKASMEITESWECWRWAGRFLF